jgi:hypothetical protein
MEKTRLMDQKAFEWIEKMPPNTWVRAFFSTYSKCDILLNNSCEVFNKYVLEVREMPILSMLEQIKTQPMTRYYNKEKEVGDMWQGPTCPKIRTKLNKNTEWANTCYAQPTGKGIFQVQVMDKQYIVDIGNKQCDCRRWDLTGIPCSHAISCLRHERIPPESVSMSVIPLQDFSLHMVLRYGLAMIRACGREWVVLKFSLLCMKRRLVGLPRIEGSNLMR